MWDAERRQHEPGRELLGFELVADVAAQLANEQVLEQVRAPAGRDVRPMETAVPGQLLERFLRQFDEHGIVAQLVVELAPVPLVGVVEHRVVCRRQHGLAAQLPNQHGAPREDEVRAIADPVRLAPRRVFRWAVELTHRERRRREQRGHAGHTRCDAAAHERLARRLRIGGTEAPRLREELSACAACFPPRCRRGCRSRPRAARPAPRPGSYRRARPRRSRGCRSRPCS